MFINKDSFAWTPFSSVILGSLFLYFWSFNLTLTAQDTNLIEAQQSLIADLSGDQLGPRSTYRQRKQARLFLSNIIEELDLEVRYLKYVQPNIHPVIDVFLAPFKGQNVYTILPATAPSGAYVLIGAHFDTERNCPGALDNGTGITLIYSVLKKLKAVESRNKNLIVVFFDQEEEELNGSRAFANYLKEQNWQVHSVHTFDTMGWDRDQDYAIEIENPSVQLDSLYRQIGRKLNIPVYTTQSISSDHTSFREMGFNTTGVTDEYVGGDYSPYKDTPKDTYDKVNFAYLASSTNLVFEVIKSILQDE